MGTSPELDAVVALLERRFGVEALVLFGSTATGTSHAKSDVDLAVLLRSRAGPVELLEATADCERLLGRSVDLVDLASASPILAMQALRDGRVAFGAESPALAAFTATLLSRYADLKRVREAAEQAILERVSRARP